MVKVKRRHVNLSKFSADKAIEPAKTFIQRPLYIVTPTFRRPEQNAELTRLSNTLKLVPNIVWVLVEDAPYRSKRVADRLLKSGVSHIHLNAAHNKPGYKGPGACRNLALKWLRKYGRDDGVMYFADDDNSYDIELFDEIRTVVKAGAWPVGLIGPDGVSTPILKNGEFVDFFDPFRAGRTFCMDMAGFAISIKFLKERPNAAFTLQRGYEEDSFLRGLHPFTPQEFEFKADKCTKILVWHTRTIENHPAKNLNREKYMNTNLIALAPHIM